MVIRCGPYLGSPISVGNFLLNRSRGISVGRSKDEASLIFPQFLLELQTRTRSVAVVHARYVFRFAIRMVGIPFSTAAGFARCASTRCLPLAAAMLMSTPVLVADENAVF